MKTPTCPSSADGYVPDRFFDDTGVPLFRKKRRPKVNVPESNPTEPENLGGDWVRVTRHSKKPPSTTRAEQR